MSVILQDANGDIVIQNGRMVVVQDAAQCAANRLRNFFRLALGEFFLDQREGVPYLQVVFVKNPDVGVIRELFRRVIMSEGTIVSTPTLDVLYDPAARHLDFEFEAKTTDGATIVGGDTKPFIVERP